MPKTHIKPEGQRTSYFANTKIYKYLCGHVIKEVAQLLPDSQVLCWHDKSDLSLQTCAINKFIKELDYCKKCPLFQEDAYSNNLCQIIEDWERDELEEK